jgi:hypothetical protein
MAELPLAQAASSADSASLAQSVSSQHPFGNGFYHLFMVIWGMVYYRFTNSNYDHISHPTSM